MKEEEVRREKNLPELVRRQWGDGELADEDPISPAVSKRGRGPAASRAKMPNDGENRCQNGGGPQRCGFSGSVGPTEESLRRRRRGRRRSGGKK
jgi:hypothetical protein